MNGESACPAAARAVSWVAVELLFLLGCGGPLVDLVGGGAGAAGAARGRADAAGAVGEDVLDAAGPGAGLPVCAWSPAVAPRAATWMTRLMAA